MLREEGLFTWFPQSPHPLQAAGSVIVVQILCVAGARPNFMKIKPVADALLARGASVALVHTGQHYDQEMSAVFFSDLGLREPDHWLGVGSGSHAQQTGRVMEALEPVMEETSPDVLVVVGDVNSTLGAALVGAKAGIRIGHVEAGLRSGDWRMPEEINRVVTDRVSDYLFAPSDDAVANLKREGYGDDQIFLVGNVMIDCLLANLERARSGDLLPRLGLEDGGYAVVTLHRPENVDSDERLAEIASALSRIAEMLPVVWPVHPRARERAEELDLGGVQLVPPAGYLDFIALEAGARLVLTDSGGIQEETTVLGIPCLTLRDTTERPVTVEVGTNRVVGTDPDKIVAAATEALEDLDRGREVPDLWDGKAAERIADVLTSGVVPRAHVPPARA